jgi:hypothetical protein
VVLSGVATGRRLGRVREVLEGVAEDLRHFKSEVSENYVKTDEFHELLENTLRRAADERAEEKRRLYRAFLTKAITSGAAAYDEQISVLRVLEQLQVDHVRVLGALLSQPRPEEELGTMGSQLQTLVRRLPGLTREHIERLVGELNDLRLTNLRSLHTVMTAHGAENLRHALTPLGSRFVEFVLGA